MRSSFDRNLADFSDPIVGRRGRYKANDNHVPPTTTSALERISWCGKSADVSFCSRDRAAYETGSTTFSNVGFLVRALETRPRYDLGQWVCAAFRSAAARLPILTPIEYRRLPSAPLERRPHYEAKITSPSTAASTPATSLRLNTSSRRFNKNEKINTNNGTVRIKGTTR